MPPEERSQSAIIVGKAISMLRGRLSISRAALAARAELETNFVSHLEEGLVNPTWGDMRRVAAGLGVSLEELASEVERLESGAERPSLKRVPSSNAGNEAKRS